MNKLTTQQRQAESEQARRSANMAAIHGKDTKPEMVVRKWLWRHGYRYRLNHPRLPGKPDVVMRKYRTCIFVNGCFWHGHNVSLTPTPFPKGEGDKQIESSDCCKIDLENQRREPASQTYSISSDDACCISIQSSECCKIPKTNREFWVRKIRRNKERDCEVQQRLASMGWHSITVWECELKPKVLEKTMESLTYTLDRIFLQDHRAKSYEIHNEKPIMAAEEAQNQ